MSLRWRLLIWQTILLAAVMIFFSGTLYGAMSHTLYAEVDDQLRRDGNTVNFLLETLGFNIPNRQNGFRDMATVVLICNNTAKLEMKIVVRNGSGNALCIVGGLELPADPVLSSDGHISDAIVGDQHMHVFTQPAPILGLSVEVARPVGDLDHTLSILRLLLLIAAFVVLILAGLLNWFLVSRLIRPLHQLSKDALRIGVTGDFSHRVMAPSTPTHDEVSQLGYSFNQMLDRLDFSYRDVKAALQKQQQFIADASHELRTPLTSISGNLELLARDALPEEEVKPTISDISSEVARLIRLVRNLLQLAHADSGAELRYSELALAPLLHLLQRQISTLNREVSVNIAHLEELSVHASPDHIHQLLLILGENAAKFTPAGGTITLSLYNHPANSDEPAMAEISIADTGPGIPLEEQARIFDRFYMLERSRTGEGTGLGLSIAQTIAAQHGGRLTVTSTPGQGSVFHLFLPCERQNQS